MAITALLTLAPFLQTGWTNDPNVWTRTGNFTFTLSTDATVWLYPGVKIYWVGTDATSTAKYGIVDTAVFGAGTTTVTLMSNTDYSMTASPSAGQQYYSYQTNPQGWPGWFNYTPTITGYSANPTNVVYRWMTVGRTCFLAFRELTNGTSNNAAHTYTLPNAAAKTVTNHVWENFGITTDNNVGAQGGGQIVSAGTTVQALKSPTSSAFTASGNSKVDVLNMWYEF